MVAILESWRWVGVGFDLRLRTTTVQLRNRIAPWCDSSDEKMVAETFHLHIDFQEGWRDLYFEAL
jgi:hypothetical protein